MQPLREKIATLKGNKKNMKKLIFFTILFTIITITGWAKTKNIVWDAPTTEYGTSYGDGYFYLPLDVTKVELKADETVEERWKQLFSSYWRDNQGDWKIALLEDCAIYKCKFWNYKECEINHITGEAEIIMQNGNDELLKKILEPYKGKFVLLDVWGTLCGPCKDALSHSTEEYAQLKDYDIESQGCWTACNDDEGR